jgi:uncharacterized protein (TIGR04255 family)
MGKRLKNKPLVEALLELKWKLDEVAPGVLQDPVYPLFLGRFHERLRKSYSYIEPLPAVHVPDELTPQVVKYRFRASKDGWPVVQAGPGVATLNFTESYDWDKFAAAAHPFFDDLLDAYAVEDQGPRPTFSSALLRYINAVPFDAVGKDVLKLLDTKFHTRVALPPKINSTDVVAGPAQGLQLLVSYPLKTPAGTGTIRFSTGAKQGQPALIWELNVVSTNEQAPQDDGIFKKWLNDAHEVVERWFFALIEGELERMFDQGAANA